MQQNSKYGIEVDEIEVEEPKDPLKECTDTDFLMLMEIVNEDISTWELVTDSENMRVFRKLRDGSPIVMLKSFGIVPEVSPA